MSGPSCPSWCARHTADDTGLTHYSESRRSEADSWASVWLFQLPDGRVRLVVDSLTVDAVNWYASPSAEDLAQLMRNLGHDAIAEAVASFIALARGKANVELLAGPGGASS